MTTTTTTTEVLPASTTTDVTTFLFDHYLDVIDNLDVSAASRLKYGKDARQFIDFIKDTGMNLNTYRQYKKHIQSLTTICTKTKNYKLVAAKALLKELHHRYRMLPVDLTAGVKSFQVNQGHVKDGLTAEEVQAVRHLIGSLPGGLKKSRLEAMFYLFAFQGLRQAEVCNLTVEDLRLADRQLVVLGKGRDDKEAVDLHPATVQALKAYLEASKVRSGNLFFSLSQNKKGKLTERSVRRLFGDVFDQAGIPSDRSVHGFRHYFVTAMLESKTFDLFEVQKFSRHKSVQTLQKYDDRKRKRELLPSFYQVFN